MWYCHLSGNPGTRLRDRGRWTGNPEGFWKNDAALPWCGEIVDVIATVTDAVWQ